MRNIEDRLKGIEREIERKKAKRDMLISAIDSNNQAIDDLEISIKDASRNVLRELSHKQKQSIADDIAKLGTLALQYSIGGDSAMAIEMDDESLNPRANVWFYRVGEEENKESPIDDNGGGIVDIISTSLRVVLMNSIDGGVDGPLILDEPFKMVSREYVPALSSFMAEISRDFGRQIIVVTHNDYLTSTADRHIEVSQGEDRVSRVDIRDVRSVVNEG